MMRQVYILLMMILLALLTNGCLSSKVQLPGLGVFDLSASKGDPKTLQKVIIEFDGSGEVQFRYIPKKENE